MPAPFLSELCLLSLWVLMVLCPRGAFDFGAMRGTMVGLKERVQGAGRTFSKFDSLLQVDIQISV